ncbi:hypothetical protein ACFLUY_03720 [Chloroflexota bacterium]
MFFYGFSNYFKPLVNEFGWSRAAVSMGTSLSRLEGALEAPLVGYLIDKVGPRKLMLFGITCLVSVISCSARLIPSVCTSQSSSVAWLLAKALVYICLFILRQQTGS